ncbi:MAG TPA: hypothetical protein VN229_24915 [Terriglobales bacterium]|nr:hypothetical protein [Terriglobales bacterium]
MHTKTNQPDLHIAKSVFTVVALASALSFAAWTNSARAADDTGSSQLSAAACSRALPSLEQAGYSAQTGHLQALKTLEACDIRLGLKEKADFTNWQIYEDLERGHPSDE